MGTTSVRLPEELLRELDRVAADRRSSRSDIIREAVEEYCTAHGAGREGDRVALLRQLVTYEGSGKGDLAERSEEILRGMFNERRRRSR